MLTTKKHRSKPYQKLRHPAEAIYASYWMAKFINRFMRHGKKAKIEKIIFQAFNAIKKKN